MGGGYTISWFIEQFVQGPANNLIQNLAHYDQLAAHIQPGCEGLVLVPYWNSVLGPYWDASASGIVVGWRGKHTSAHFFRAILEGIAYEQRLNTQGVELALGQSIARFVVVGGGARSPLWCQVIADVTGKPVVRAETNEAAALGAGILAAAGVGLFTGVRQASLAMAHFSSESFLPDQSRNLFYSRIFEDVYRRLYPSLQSILQNL
jgi:xylulokinase